MAKINFMTQIMLWQNDSLKQALNGSAADSAEDGHKTGIKDYIAGYSVEPSGLLTKRRAYGEAIDLFNRFGKGD